MPSVKGFLDRINPWHEKPEAPPPITVRTAVLLLAAYAILYFLPFYLSATTRPSPNLSRDAPSVIQSRIRSVLLSCTICTFTTCLILTHFRASPSDILHLTGLYPLALTSSLRALGLTALLFLGPLFDTLVVDRSYTLWLSFPPQPLAEVWSDWATWRNLVAGPVTEELLFRSASIPLMLLARASVKETVFLSPVVFGLAHFHHFYEFRLTNPGVPFAAALARSVFQLGFTTLFGAYATFIYIRTGSLLAVCAVHTFCNCMGLPRLWGRVTRTVPVKGGKDDDDLVVEEKASLKWTVLYYVLLVAGAVGFYRNFWGWTESANALVPSSAFGKV
ncbi:Abi-domain-containing protein [Coniochaeta sp. PMI_546]|nr:Abi-domain-containing protein [Coniochaeta sp. PMI_546]